MEEETKKPYTDILCRLGEHIEYNMRMTSSLVWDANEEIQRLGDLLLAVGVCPDCGEEFDHELEAPFAWCKCGTVECCEVPLIAKLRYQLSGALPNPYAHVD